MATVRVPTVDVLTVDVDSQSRPWCAIDWHAFPSPQKWTLFPPDQSENMYPQRLPFEESSVWSGVDVLMPDLAQHPKFAIAQAHVQSGVLEPGDVLFVPRHYW